MFFKVIYDRKFFHFFVVVVVCIVDTKLLILRKLLVDLEKNTNTLQIIEIFPKAINSS